MPPAFASRIRDVPDFPKKGIVFKDITTLLKDAVAFRRAMDLFVVLCGDRPVDKVVAIESRGFIFGGLLADRLRVGFVPVRKLGKLPAETASVEYALEYGTNTLEIHKDALKPGQKVLIVDDLLATGGTAEAVGRLVTRQGAEVAEYAFVVELGFLPGRKRLGADKVFSLVTF